MSFSCDFGRLLRVRSVLVACAVGGAAAMVTAPAAMAYPTSGFTIWTVAGNGQACASPTGSCGDGSTAVDGQLNLLQGVALDSGGNVYIADTADNKIRKLTPTGALSTVAGNGTACASPTNACGDGGPATAANLFVPRGVALDAAGNLYIADAFDNRIRKVTPSGTISTVVGNGTQCAATTDPCGDGGSATDANLNTPTDVRVDSSGNLYVDDKQDNRIRKVSTSGTITTIDGNGTACAASTNPCGDGGAATAANLALPWQIALDGAGNLFIADRNDERVREVSSGNISTVVGNGTACAAPTNACGDGGAATSANLNLPSGITVESNGDILIADSGDHRVREVTANGLINTIAGTGTTCSPTTGPCGDGGAASAGLLNFPVGLAVDSGGNILVGDNQDNRVRWLAGPQSGPAGPAGPAGSTGAPGSTGPRGPQGAQGPPGKVELVTCKTVTRTVVKTIHGKRRKVKVTRRLCKTKLISGTVKFTTSPASDRATLSRGHTVYATGTATGGRRLRLLLAVRRRLAEGGYRLSLRDGHGRMHSTSITIS